MMNESELRAKLAATSGLGDHRGAAELTMQLAELIAVRSAEGAAVTVAQAQVHATLHLAEQVYWVNMALRLKG